MNHDSLMANARIALACLDLTSLNDHDDVADIEALCLRAQGPAGQPAALCVWPRLAAYARSRLPVTVRVAAVANFPHGALDPEQALMDVRAIVAAGADEIDLVLPWRALLEGHGQAGASSAAASVAALVAGLVAEVRAACPGLLLKLILESGELATAQHIRQASLIGLDAGVDFLKTSTGKRPVGATPEAARVMLETIAGHPRGGQVGFKASGGIRSVVDAAVYIDLVRDILGAQALGPHRLRFGASGLLGELERVLAGVSPGAAAPTSAY